MRRRDNGRIAPFERVIIETTGLADPAPVLQTILVHPYLPLRSRLDGVVTLIDAVNGSSTLDAHEEAVKQAAMADRLVLSKTDLLTEGGALRALCARLAKLNPGAVLLDAAEGQATAASLLNAGIYDPDQKIFAGQCSRPWPTIQRSRCISSAAAASASSLSCAMWNKLSLTCCGGL